MPIIQPSQYDCDNMEKGDLVAVKSRGPLYKFIRKYFKKDKILIKVRKNYDTNNTEYNTYYQEDCVLYRAYELQCIKSYRNVVPYNIMYRKYNCKLKAGYLKQVDIGLYNIQLSFKNGINILIPTDFIENGINNNKLTLQQMDRDKLMAQQLKYSKYTGATFRNIVDSKHIEEFKPQYCSICGNPVVFRFDDSDIIRVDNTCTCGCLNVDLKELSYDQFAVWYSAQVDKYVKRNNDKFWFDKEV